MTNAQCYQYDADLRDCQNVDYNFVFRVSLQLTHTLCVYLYVVSCKYALQTVLK